MREILNLGIRRNKKLQTRIASGDAWQVFAAERCVVELSKGDCRHDPLLHVHEGFRDRHWEKVVCRQAERKGRRQDGR
ncbi:hypothetical protein AAJCM20276_24060 [Acetobacter aceti]|uniref:Uncharacterized protein n=1 Tax=Acetobacter aceti TaxID=435 RepID=A0A6S6PST9_ACEAC|nr:hypothetical protein AAJCM20276_24060 [Acetobacter aceti]